MNFELSFQSIYQILLIFFIFFQSFQCIFLLPISFDQIRIFMNYSYIQQIIEISIHSWCISIWIFFSFFWKVVISDKSYLRIRDEKNARSIWQHFILVSPEFINFFLNWLIERGYWMLFLCMWLIWHFSHLHNCHVKIDIIRCNIQINYILCSSI